MKFLSHETTFLIYENKKIKEDRKTSHVIKCVMIIKKSYRKKNLFYINVKLSVKLSFSQHFDYFFPNFSTFSTFTLFIRRSNYITSRIRGIE